MQKIYPCSIRYFPKLGPAKTKYRASKGKAHKKYEFKV